MVIVTKGFAPFHVLSGWEKSCCIMSLIEVIGKHSVCASSGRLVGVQGLGGTTELL